MLNLLKIGVTGPIASGKSTVCDMLSKQGAYVIKTDDLVHDTLRSDLSLQKQISQLLNTSINFLNDSYRKQIAELVFQDSRLLHQYEKLIHPLVMEAISLKYKEIKSKSYKMFVCEIPLLYELESEAFFDKIIYVSSRDELCKERFHKKTHYDSLEWSRRMSRFTSQEKAKKHAIVINNDGKIEDLNNQINHFLNSLHIN